jgi:hypothetical protein
MFRNHLKKENMNIEQWVMQKNLFLILNIFLKNNKTLQNQPFPMIVRLPFFFLLKKINILNIKAKEASTSNKDRPQRKPGVPSIRDAPKMGARTEKNFIQTNALDVVMTVPKKAERNIVDDRFGDKYPIDPSGLAPKYIFKKVFQTISTNSLNIFFQNFGEVPVYIKTRRADMEKSKQEYQAYVSDYFRRGAMREMDENERQTIMDGLF